MSTGIPISADPSQAVAAVEQITAAIRKSGQEGRKFAELDLSHPELKGMADDIGRMQANFEELKKVGRGATAAAVRKGGYDNFIEWEQGNARQFPDEKQRRNHRNAVGGYINQGTRWDGGGSSGGGEGGSGGGGFGLGGLPIPGLGKLLGIGLGLAGIGKVTSMLSSGVGDASDEAIQLDTFKRMINDTSTEFNDLRDSLREAGNGLQLTYNETVKLAQSFAKASAYSDAERINKEVNSAAGFARAFGLNPNQVTQMFGKSRWLQAGGGKDTSPKEMATMFADAIAAGNMWGKADEVMSAIIGFTQSQERVSVDAPNVKAYASLSSSMNASGRPGLQGAAGELLLNLINKAMQQGGQGGDAGKNFLWRALNPDGKMDPYEMRLQQEKGMFGRLPDGRVNFEAANDLAKKMYANPLQRADALSNVFGTSMTQMLALSNLKPGSYGKLGDMMERYGINQNKINATSFQDLASVATADGAGLEGLRASALKRGDLNDSQKKAIERAKPGEDLRKTLALNLKDVGREQTAGMKTLDAVTAMRNALTNTGSNLLKPIYEIKGFVAEMVNGATKVAENPGDEMVGGLARTLSKGLTDSFSTDYMKKRPVSTGPGVTFNKDGVPIEQAGSEIKLINEVVVIHKNENGALLNKERLPVTTKQLRE